MRHFLAVLLLAALCLVSPSSANNTSLQSSNDIELFPVAVSRRMGYINAHGKLVISMKFRIRDVNGFFHDEQYFKDGLALVSDGKQSGFIDRTGRFVIRGPYDPRAHFSDGLARVADANNRIGFIDKSGKIVIQPQFDRAEDFAGDLAVVQVHGRWGYIDKRGRMAIAPRFDDAQSFEEGFAHVNISRVRRGYIDQTGRFLPLPYDVEDFRRPSEGLMAIKVENKWAFMNMAGQIVIGPQFEPDLDDYHQDRFEGIFKNGLAFAKKDGKFGYIDKTGKFVIPPKFDKATHFREDLARVAINGKWGLINGSGEFVAAPQFQELHHFVEGLAVASIDGVKFGYLDRKGKLIIPPQFNEALHFSEGLACVKKEVQVDGKTTWLWGYIDKSGQFIIKPQFTYHGVFENGLARQMIYECVCIPADSPGFHNEWGYIDRTGKFVWKSTDQGLTANECGSAAGQCGKPLAFR